MASTHTGSQSENAAPWAVVSLDGETVNHEPLTSWSMVDTSPLTFDGTHWGQSNAAPTKAISDFADLTRTDSAKALIRAYIKGCPLHAASEIHRMLESPVSVRL